MIVVSLKAQPEPGAKQTPWKRKTGHIASRSVKNLAGTAANGMTIDDAPGGITNGRSLVLFKTPISITYKQKRDSLNHFVTRCSWPENKSLTLGPCAITSQGESMVKLPGVDKPGNLVDDTVLG